MSIKAILVAGDGAGVSRLTEALSNHSISVTVSAMPDEALDECRRNPPHLAIVESDLGAMTGVRFLAELLKVSWTTSTILIADEDEESIHDRTEGLGILGSIRTTDDIEGLERLLARFTKIVPSDQQFPSAKQ